MNNLLEYKGYYGTVEFSEADNIHFGKVMGIRSLILYEGDNLKALKEDFEGAINFYIESCKERGVKPEKPYKKKLDLRLSPELHRTLDFYSVSHGKSIDSTVEEAIKYFCNNTDVIKRYITHE